MGAGGQWLGHTIRLMEDNNLEIAPGNVNFHNRLQSEYFYFTHTLLENTNQTEFLLGTKHKFNLFLNTHAKLFVHTNHNNFNYMSTIDQLYTLSNLSRWYFSDEYVGQYETDIDLNYDNVINNAETFRNQLLTVLEHTWPREYLPRVTQSFVTHACQVFRQTTINPSNHLGNVDSLAWLGWCDAIFLLKNINIPIELSKNFNAYQNWVSSNQKLIIETTMPFVLL
jgi:hypothetical protein